MENEELSLLELEELETIHQYFNQSLKDQSENIKSSEHNLNIT